MRGEADAWRRLAGEAGLDPLCNDPSWALDHAAAYAEPGDVLGWTFEDADGEPVGILPLKREPSRGPLALRRATLVQDGSNESDYLDLPVRPGSERAVAAAAVDALRRRRELQAVVLSCVPESSPRLAALRAELEARSLPRREVGVACISAELPDSLDVYVQGLKSRMRSKVRSAVRKAHEQGAELRWCDEPTELAEHLGGLFRLHAGRWQEAGEAGSFDEPARRAFYDRLVPRLLAEGALRLSRLELDGRPVAYQFGAVVGDRYYQVQEGYDVALSKERPATALRALSIEALIADGVRHYDFMAGDSRHKRDWRGTDRPCVTVAFALPRLRARLSYALRARLDARRGTDSGGE
jgi:CelD/BcsL family acetyltransferase involved in cellulose biosynthesis